MWMVDCSLAKLPVETHLLHTMLVRTRMGIHPLGYMLGTDGWYTGLVVKEALMQFTTSLMLSTKLGLD
jgi:hypothetical protein